MRWPLVTRKRFEELDDAYGSMVRYASKLEGVVQDAHKANVALQRKLAHYQATSDTGLIVGSLKWQDVIQ